MKHLNSKLSKLVFAICILTAFSAPSQIWLATPTSSTAESYREGTVSIGTTNVVTAIPYSGAANWLLIVGFGNQTKGNIGQWHGGDFHRFNSSESYWMDLGSFNSLEYGMMMQYRKSTGVVQLHRITGADPADMDIIWGSLDGEDHETDLYFRYAKNVTATASAPVIASLNNKETFSIGSGITANIASFGASSFEEKSLFVENKILVGEDGTAGTISAGFRDAALNVWGSAVIGGNSTYNATTVPTNGLLVEGQVGINNPVPNALAVLDLGGDIVMGLPGNGQRFMLHTRPSFSGDAFVISADDGSGVFFNNKDFFYDRSTDCWSIDATPSSSFSFVVNGSAFCSGTWTSSDSRLKNEINSIEDPLKLLKKLNPVSYNFKQDIMIDKFGKPTRFDLPKEKQYGFIAQDVQKIFPELVQEAVSGYLALNYTEFIPMLVAGVNQQQATIELLQTQLQEAQVKLACIPVCDGNTTQPNSTNIASGKLEQNVPNPFGAETTIKFTLPTNTKSAIMLISNLEGKQLQKIAIGNDATQIKIAGSTLAAGTYYYTLIADGKVIDTKKMIIIGY